MLLNLDLRLEEKNLQRCRKRASETDKLWPGYFASTNRRSSEGSSRIVEIRSTKKRLDGRAVLPDSDGLL